MRKRRLKKSPFVVFVVYLFLFGLCFMLLEENKTVQEQNDIFVSITRDDGVIELELEQYIVGVVASEMPSSFELEALKAQSVAARSFVVSRNYQVDDSTASQVYKDENELRLVFGNEYEERISKIQKAVEATKGEVLYYNNQVINALFFSTSNGQTVNSQEYYTNELPYLQAVSSEWDLKVNENAVVETFYSLADLRKLLGVSGPVNISIVSRYDNHRVKSVKVNNTTYTGRELRELLVLRSTDFTVTKQKDGYTFKTVGFGHGVGMSQYGAQGMALEGYTYDEILEHYYKNVEIKKLY